MNDIRVHCPNCSNQRLFDIESGAEGNVKIKCPKCKSVVFIQLHLVNKQGILQQVNNQK